MVAVSPVPVFSDEVSAQCRFSPSFSGHQDPPMQRSAAAPSSWSNHSSPDFHRECNQVYETLGSLQKALSLSGDVRNVRMHEEAHRQEADSLWRENRELRSEVRVWQDEAKTLQRQNADLQLQVAQLLAELDAERTLRASPALGPAMNVSATPRAGASGGGNSHWFGPQATPMRDLTNNMDVSQVVAATAATPMSRRVSTRGSSCGGLTVAEEAELSSRHADELVALSARHAGEVAELQVRHAHSLEMLHGEADIARSTAGAAVRRCRFAERSASRAEAAALSLSLEAAKLTCQIICFAAWRRATMQALLLSSSRRARLLAAGKALRIGQHRLAKCYCWLIWLGAMREAFDKRDMRAMEVQLLRGQFLRHAQLSWCFSHRAMAEVVLIVRDTFLCWRSHVAVVFRRLYGGKLDDLQLRYRIAREGVDRLSALASVQKLARSVVAAWHSETQSSKMLRLKDQASQALEIRLIRLERQASGLRDRLTMALQGSLKQKAWLALWLVVHLHGARAETARAKQAHHLAERLDCVTIRALQACLRYQNAAEIHWILEAWCALVDAARWGRIAQVLEGRLTVLQARLRDPEALIRCVEWGSRKVLLHRTLGGWWRLLQRAPGALGRLELEQRLQDQQLLSLSQKQALLKTISALLGLETLFWTWSCWLKAWHDSARQRRERNYDLQDSRRRQSMEQVHARLFRSASRVQAGFVLRACWAIWRRSRVVQRMVSGGEELCRLRAAHAYLEHARCSQVQHFSEKLWQQHLAAVAYVVWIAWRRRTREGEMLIELEKLQQLLLVFHTECQRQQENVLVEAWMETQGATFVGGGMVEGAAPGSLGTSARQSPTSVAELQRPWAGLQSSSSPTLRPHHPLPQEPLRPAAWPSASPRC